MTDDRLPLAELMAKTGDGDFLRNVPESVLQIIREADVDGLITSDPASAARGATATAIAAWTRGWARST